MKFDIFSTKIIRYSIRGDHRSIFPDFSWRPAALARASTGSPIRATRAWSMEPEPVERAETREPGAPDVSGIFVMIDDVSNMFQHIWVWAWNLRLNEPVSLFILFSRVISTLGAYTYFPSRRPVTLDVQHGRPRLKIDAFGPLQADGNGALQLLTIQNVRWFMIQAWPRQPVGDLRHE